MDRSLATLLRALQSPSISIDDAQRLIGSASTLLTLLSNPLNLSLLTTHLLSAPAIWSDSPGLNTSLALFTCFHSAGVRIASAERERLAQASKPPLNDHMSDEAWVRAVVKGLDESTERWKHAIVLGALLNGLEGHHSPKVGKLRRDLERALITAANLALNDLVARPEDDVAQQTICLALGYSFDKIKNFERSRIDATRLLPALIRMVFFSKDGLHYGYFVGMLDSDVTQGKENTFNWPQISQSFVRLQKMGSGPIGSAFGVLARLSAFCVESIKDNSVLFGAVEDITAFSRSLCVQWRQNKLSEVDVTEESLFMTREALDVTMPYLWQILRSAMFFIIMFQTALVGRLIGDSSLPTTQRPMLTIQTLRTLRYLYFIPSRLGHNSFSQFLFVYTASIEILSRHTVQAEAFLQEIRPVQFGQIPEHPHERCCDLFFLNTAEQIAAHLPPAVNEHLLLAAAIPYLGTGNDPRLLEIFEAAHSVTLAVFSAPQNHALTIAQLPFYIDTLFQVFPNSLSARQFRLAIKTLVHISSPPSLISKAQPLLPQVILEMVRSRSSMATTLPIPPASFNSQDPVLSEQAAFVLAIIDSLPALPSNALDEWMNIAAAAMNNVQDRDMLELSRARFWEVLSNGEMDVLRAEIAVKWWGTCGGREAVLQGKMPMLPMPGPGDEIPAEQNRIHDSVVH